MKSPTQDTLDLGDIFDLWSNYRGMIMLGTALTALFFTAAAYVIPQRFKSNFVIAIHSSYFQNPLTRDLTPDIYDSAEMRSQRETLIRQSLTPEFLDSLGEKRQIYKSGASNVLQQFLNRLPFQPKTDAATRRVRLRSSERQELAARISVINLNNDTFKVSFIYTDPVVAMRVTEDIYTQVMRGLTQGRRNNLLSLRIAIQKRLGDLAASLPPPSEELRLQHSDAQPFAAPPRVKDELAEIRGELRVMSVRYTEEHPMVKELRERERALIAAMNEQTGGMSNYYDQPEESLANRLPTDAAVEMYKDLTRKLNYLNISFESSPGADVVALEKPMFPTSALWPTKGLIILWGFAAGLIGFFFIAALREYFSRTTLRAEDLSHELAIPFIGELPIIAWGMAYPNCPKSGSALRKTPYWN